MWMLSVQKLLLEPSPEHLATLIVNLIFLCLFLCQALVKQVGRRRTQPPPGKPADVNALDKPLSQLPRSGLAHKTALGCCIFLSATNFARLLWILAYGARYGIVKPAEMLPEVGSSAVQVVAWLVMTIATERTGRAGKRRYPGLLRAWWIVSCLFALGSVALDIYALVASHSPMELRVGLDMVSTPAVLFLSVIGIYGQTSVIDDKEGLREPLLGSSEEKVLEGEKVTPYSNAGIFSTATISWLNPVLAVGARKPLEAEDLPLLASEHRSKTNYRLLQSAWNDLKVEDPESRPSLIKAIGRSYWKAAARTAFFAGTTSCASFVGPFLISDFVNFLGGQQRFAYEGYVLAFCFFGAKLVESLTQRQCYLGTELLGLRVRSALTGFVYWKGLKLSSESRQSHTVAEIINYMAVDVTRIGDFAWYLHDIWMLPLQITLALAILCRSVGIATLATLVTTVFALTATTPIGRIIERFQGRLMKAKDERMKATAECLRSMRTLKLQAWENRFLAKVEQLRKEESHWLAKSLYTTCVNTFIFWATPTFVSVFTFATCVFLGIPLTAGRVLSALATFRVLQEPLRNFPDLVSTIAQTKVSLNRIWHFLQEPELRSDAVTRIPMDFRAGEDEAAGLAVQVAEGTFSWDPCLESSTLRSVNLKVKLGERVAVCGVVGSGKSSLLSCLLGEIPKISGTVLIRGKTAYVAQTPWIQSGSVQDNILFGSPMDAARYERVLDVCQLKKDLELFPHGDRTEIGERGINFSGGQKQRIQLARAVYQDADIYILDDPFSALDAQTGSQIFKECILQELGLKTVVFVTHQVDFLSVADQILVLRDGEIVESGKYDELLQAGTDFTLLVGAHNEAVDAMDAIETLAKEEEEEDELFSDELYPAESITLIAHNEEDEIQSPRCKTDESFKEKSSDSVVDSKKKKKKKAKKLGKGKKYQLVQDEERARGNVSMHVYISYLTAVYGGALVPLVLFAMIMFQVLQIAGNWWMAWATPTTEEEPSRVSNTILIGVYTALALGSALFILIRAVLVATVGLLTANKFFYKMIRSIFRAPMSFFDSTPTGRILNRASTDQSSMDLEVHSKFRAFGSMSVQLFAIIFVMAQASWVVLVLFTPVIVLCILIQRYYIASARELARLVGIQKSPTIHHYSESIAGAATIRGFGQQQRFMATNLKLLDCYGQPLFHNFAAIEWLVFRMELLSVMVFAVMLLLVVTFPNSVDASMAGLAVTYGLQLNSRLSKWVWELCNLENKVIAVERIQQYSDLPSEAPLIIDENRPPKEWPLAGTVELRNLQVRYSLHAPLVLHGITCNFPAGTRVGIVGRTGCGKSTLIQALFRMVEPAGGEILIDGLNVCTIGLHDLRSKLSIIPQDPLLFEGTVRGNLDPLEDFSDVEVWEALDKCQLGGIVRAKDGKLDAPVSENGENWSVGQRQLLCLGRTLLKRTRILVLDEATASVDSTTDNVMQRTIREEFVGCTVITVAHRIPTVIDSDQVLVLSDGRVADFDTPAKLLENKFSMLSLLVNEYCARAANLCDLAASGRLASGDAV